jgi:hypothetical protein
MQALPSKPLHVAPSREPLQMSDSRGVVPLPPAKRLRMDGDGMSTATRKPNIVGPLAEKLKFWFSAANLRKDRFLAERMAGNDGAWVTVDDILTFKSVIALGSSRENVLDTAQALACLDVDADTGGGRVRLAGGMDAFRAVVEGTDPADEDARTLYASPVPVHVNREELLGALEHFSTSILYVSIPRHVDGRAKGFCFIEFDTAVNATACADALDKMTLTVAKVRYPCLRAITKTAWRARKEIQKSLDKDARRRRAIVHSSLQLADDAGCQPAPLPSEADKEMPKFTSGVILYCTDLPLPTSRRELHKMFEQYGSVNYVEYNQSDPMVCHVRFADATAAAIAVERSRPRLNAALLTGENEQQYWDKLLSDVGKSRARDKTRLRRQKSIPCHHQANSPVQDLDKSRMDNNLLPSASKAQVARLHRKFKDDDDEG